MSDDHLYTSSRSESGKKQPTNQKERALMQFSSKPRASFLLVFFCSVLFLSKHAAAAAAGGTIGSNRTTFIIGAIVDLGSRVGREQKTGMEIAVQNFNARSEKLKLSIQFGSSSGDPLQAALAAEKLIREGQAQVIIGTEKWQEAALVADIGSRVQVPFLSLSASAVTPPLSSLQWPFLVQMANDATEQTKCLTQIIHSYQWRRVIVVYEDEPYGGDSGILTLLSQALQEVGSEIEHHLVLPPNWASLTDPKEAIHQLLEQVIDEQYKSRVFIILDVSWTLAHSLFDQAREVGLMGKDSVWLMTEGIANLFSSLNNESKSVIQGALGIKRYYARSRMSFQDFEAQFWVKFSMEYPEEDNSDPGFYSLLAYDGITAIGRAIEGLSSNNNNASGAALVDNILASNFKGLSGEKIYFEDNKIASLPAYEIVNVVDKELRELGFWIPGLGGISTSLIGNESAAAAVVGESGLFNEVTWPGNLTGVGVVPKGWDMPTESKKMRIGVPLGLPSKFVFLPEGQDLQGGNYSGFCIDLFQEVRRQLNYDLPYTFIPYNDSYDNLVLQVYDKKFDAAVGDVTILANRTDYVDFTQPYAESGLSLILPSKPDAANGWTFMRPFTLRLWLLTMGILIYTAFIVWVLEHRTNKEFQGTCGEQISASLWFTFNSLFFSQREDIKGNYTKVVIVVWLFIVLVLTQSYTADLASTLTILRLNNNSTDVETLLRSNATVGCDRDSFITGFLEDVLQFNSDKIITLGGQPEDIFNGFRDGNMTAAFIELPYAKLFHYKYCDGYTITGPLYRFGGLGFAFPKGSPISIDVSRAILTLTENGKVKDLEKKWLIGNTKCSDETDESSDNGNGRLDVDSFWGLFVFSFATSTICLALSFIVPRVRKYRQHQREFKENLSGGNNARQMLSFATYILGGVARGASVEDGVIQQQTPVIEDRNGIPVRRSSTGRWDVHVSGKGIELTRSPSF
ncbi:hypothetical protein Dimus_032686 [Dionaea muscipula]